MLHWLSVFYRSKFSHLKPLHLHVMGLQHPCTAEKEGHITWIFSDSFRAQVSLCVRANKQKTWDLQKNEGETKQKRTISSLKTKKKAKAFFLNACTPTNCIITGTAPIWQSHQEIHLISLLTGFLPSFSDTPIFLKEKKVWWHLWLSGVSGMCVFMCTDVCTHLSLSFCFTCTKAWFSFVCLFLGKTLTPFLPLKWRQSQVRFLACSYPNDTVTQGGQPSKRHLLLYHMTGCAFGMHNLSATVSNTLQ